MGVLARQGYRSALLAVTILAVAVGLEAEGKRTAAQILSEAALLMQRDRGVQALADLRSLRAEFPKAPEAAESLALSIEICLSAGDAYRARFFLTDLAVSFPGSSEVVSSAIKIADYCSENGPWEAALEYYAMAVREYGAKPVGPGIGRAMIRAAELALYRAGDVEGARRYLGRVEPKELPPEELPAYRALSVRLCWDELPPKAFGLSDGNVSALHADGGDLWIGTWNGGVSRYSVASGDSDAYPLPASMARSIEVADRRVWVGTADGLAWYSKASSRWGQEAGLASDDPISIQALLWAAGDLYAGTLGKGLLRLRQGAWEQVTDGELPGQFITCLAADREGKRLLIGTMTQGLLILDLDTSKIRALSEDHPELAILNVTTILPDSRGGIWIGTYGDGLFLWSADSPAIRSYRRSGGEIGDDWVLAAHETAGGIYFGTFGGGVSVLDPKSGAWRRLGISDGLGSLDITSIASVGPYVFFGTLGAGVSRYLEGPPEDGDGPQF